MEAHHIAVKHLQAADYAGYLKGAGIETVPVIFVNESRQKTYLLGRDAMRNYVLTHYRKETPAVFKPVSTVSLLDETAP